MFGIEKLKKDISELEASLKSLKVENAHLKCQVEDKVKSLENRVAEKLILFEKEIFDKSFASMENIMRFTKEVSLIETLASQIKDKDLIALQTSLMKPVLEQRWEKEKQEKAGKVDETLNSKGAEILKRREELHQQRLALGREKKDTKELDIQIQILDWIIEK